MPAGLDPKGSRQQKLGTIQTKRNNCGSTHGGQPNNTQAISTPAEMFGPGLPIWVKNADDCARTRVYRRNAVALE
ncbi:MAG TPA: hypothetical protein PL105_08190 [Caldilineaceae bacterium]|nr:hypothetical protein [Caldilineaceae bacterium]